MSIESIQKEIVTEFAYFDDWQERYEYLIDLGRSLPAMHDTEKNESKIIVGCQSRVWLDAKMAGENIVLTADADAILPKGIAALLVRIYSNQKPKDIMNTDTNFITEIGLHEFLSPSRANGLLAMIKQIKFYAMAYKIKADRV